MKSLNTPVLFLVFNRPDTTKQVFEAIGKARPKQLFVAGDGPVPGRLGEEERCRKVQQIASNVDWDCDLRTQFRKENLGCRKAVSSAIDWFFDNVEEGIILEDDCLPSQSFFWFCQELLERYRHDQRVLHIGGTNPVDDNLTSQTYYFSKYNRIWGWASWKRAWRYFDSQIKFWPELRDKKTHYQWFKPREARIWERAWDRVYANKVDAWGYQWFLCRLMQGKAIVPCVNLVSNIGFNKDATHTFHSVSLLSNLPRGEITFPLIHPESLNEDAERDLIWSRNFIVSKKSHFLKMIMRLFK